VFVTASNEQDLASEQVRIDADDRLVTLRLEPARRR
jgi:hypothetical protein